VLAATIFPAMSLSPAKVLLKRINFQFDSTVEQEATVQLIEVKRDAQII
jgi:hypothetical protein